MIAIDKMLLEPLRSVPAYSNERMNTFYNNVSWDNIGNYFISQALTDILDFEEAILLTPHSTDKAIDYANSNCSVYIIRGATMLGEGKISKNLPYEFIKKIKIPIVWIGYGIENPLGVKVGDLNEEDVNVLKYIHDSTTSSMVRGATSASILSEYGIDNCRILGCPTFYWSRKNINKINKPKWDNVYWTWREHLYSPGKEQELRKLQFEAVDKCRNKAEKLTVTLQDMSERTLIERYFVKKRDDRYVYIDNEWPSKLKTATVNREELEKRIYDRYKNLTNESMITWLMNNILFSFDLNEYRTHLTNADFILGCRLHANIMGLSHGVPAYFYAYDERLQEIVDLIEVPYGRLTDEPQVPEIESLDFSKYEAKYKILYQGFKEFLNENNVPHRLE